MYGKSVYELFYHNWNFIQGQNTRQVKVGRLGILDDRYGRTANYIYDNDYKAFTPETLRTSREAHFGLYGERIAFKHVEQNTVHYSSVCGYDQYYTNRGSMSSQDFCLPCHNSAMGGPNDRMITLGVQDTQCMTCSQLEFDQRPIPQFFYQDICNQLPDCSTATTYPVSDRIYNIPARGTQRSENVISQWSSFISSPIQGCSYQYSLQNANGGLAPSYYSISNTGVLTFQNDGNANNLVNDRLRIVITATGGAQTVIKQTTDFNVQTQCGPDSTTVTVGQMPNNVAFPASQFSSNMYVSGSCASSQPLCPITWQQLNSGTQYFTLQYQSNNFQAYLRQQYSNTPNSYSFSVKCEASGGAHGFAYGSLSVSNPEFDCTTAQIYSFGYQDYTLRYDLPGCGQNTQQTIFQQSSAYIAPAVSGCTQTFYLKNAANPNVPAPDYYRLDPVTGVLSFDNRADQLVNDQLIIEIHSTDGVQNRVLTSSFNYPYIQQSQTINVITQCGLQSTVVDAPVLATRTQMANTNFNSLSLTDSCTSCNIRCPITSYSLSNSGFNQFSQNMNNMFQLTSLVNSGQNSFTVSLSSNMQMNTGSYSYSVVCAAQGGASDTATGTMIVAQPEYDCRTAVLSNINCNQAYDIPAPGQQRTETIFNRATDFITAPVTGCSQSYRLEMVNGMPVPSYYYFNQQNGQLSVNLDGNQELIYDAIRIVVSSTDGVTNRQNSNYNYPYEQTTSQCIIQTRCGPSSTTVIAPTLGNLQQHSNAVQQGQQNRLEITSGFSCSNPRCPIISTTLVEGNNEFDLQTISNTGNQFVNVGFNYLNTQQAFVVNLKSQYISQVDQYYYAVQGTCQGGSTAQAPGMMEVTPPEIDCTGSFVGIPQTEYRFDIPREGQSISQTLFERASIFVTPPIQGCYQTYELRMADGRPVPSYFNMNENTGYLSFTNRGDQIINDCLEIVIVSTDGLNLPNRLLNYQYPHYQTTSTFCVITECGPGSTIVSHAPLPIPTQPANLAPNPLMVSGQFVSSNSRCPIVDTQLILGFNKFNLQENVQGFTLYLNSDHLTLPDCYQYILEAVARGGAVGDASSSMCVTPYEYDCTIGSMRPTQTFFNYDVPAPSSFQSPVTLISQNSYMNTKPEGCTQCFSLERRNGLNIPNYYQFNDLTGVLSFTNPSQIVDDEFVLKVFSVDDDQCSYFNYDHVEEHVLTVRSVCGISSTDCRLPTQLFDLAQPSNAEFNGLFVDDFFQSTNPACPVTSISLIEGQVNYDLVTSQLNQQNAQFSVELKDSLLTSQNTYEYTVRATLAGGETCDASGLMRVGPPEYDCTLSQIVMTIPDSSQDFCMANAGQEYEQELFRDASQYVTNPEPNCARSYALEMTNGSPLPDYFNINPVTGRITVIISGDYFLDDVIRVVITSGDFVQRTGNIYVVSGCCPDSTVITRPQLSYLQQAANSQTNGLILTSDFDSSNPLCPITAVALCDGNENFDFVADVYNVNTRNVLDLYENDYSDFIVSLNSFLITTEGSYTYSVCAVALGGAESTYTSTMTVTPPVYDCSIPTPRNVLDTYDFEIPRPGASDYRTIFMSSAEYISSPIVGCVYSYSLETCNGNSVIPDRYLIDNQSQQGTGSGKIQVLTDGDATLIDDDLRVVITSMSINQQGMPADVKSTDCFNVRTRCGPSSTDVLAPDTCESLEQRANDNINDLIVVDSFSTTNPRCNIEFTELVQGRQHFDFEDYNQNGGYEVSLKNEFLQSQNTYFYTVRGYAQGGAFAMQECQMKVTPPVYDCSLAQRRTIQDDFYFHIPRPGIERDEVLFESSADYFTGASIGCNQQYSIELTEDSTTYGFNYYSLGMDGRLVFRNVGTQTVVDHLKIVITSIGGPEVVTQYSDTITVITECGPDSTDVLSPSLFAIEMLVNAEATTTDRFSSTNNVCPILSHQFCAGSSSSNQFALVDRADQGFEVTLRDTYSTSIGSYTYEVCATAKGGAVGDATGVMRINPICGGAITQCTSDKSFFIPEFGEQEELLLSGRSAYISELAGCDYSYQLVMANGQAVPNYYSIDQADGSVMMDNRANTPVDERIGIVISAMDDYGNVQTYETCYFKVQTVCGIDSTTVIPPTANEVQVEIVDDNVISVTGSFGVSNPSCPIQIISLLSDSTPYFRLDQTIDMRFVVSRQEDYCELGAEDMFTVFAQARGFQSAEFDYEGFFCNNPYVEPEIESEPEIEPIPDPTPTPVLPTPVLPEPEPTPQIVVLDTGDEDTVVRSAVEEESYPWGLTVLVVAVIVCAMCLVFVLIISCCREKLQPEAQQVIYRQQPQVIQQQQQYQPMPVQQVQLKPVQVVQQQPVISDTVSVMSVPTVQAAPQMVHVQPQIQPQVQYVQAAPQMQYVQQAQPMRQVLVQQPSMVADTSYATVVQQPVELQSVVRSAAGVSVLKDLSADREQNDGGDLELQQIGVSLMEDAFEDKRLAGLQHSLDNKE